jgi:hypothetical protein
VLPVTEALPPEFQLPNRAHGRGQLVRVSFADEHRFAVAEKIHVTGCYLENCRVGLPEIIRTAIHGLKQVGNGIGRSVKRLRTLALENIGSTTPAAAATKKPI